MNLWTVAVKNQNLPESVIADACTISPAGALVFYGVSGEVLRAFSAHTWEDMAFAKKMPAE